MSLFLAVSTILALAQPAAVPPPLEQTSADCARPTYASDMLVCGDSELKARDAELAGLVSSAPLAGAALMESDADWFKRSRRCAFEADHRACIAAAYAGRLTLRRMLAVPAPDASKPATCKGGKGTQDVSLAVLAEGTRLVIRDRATGAPLGVAPPPSAKDAPWQSFASFTRKGKRVTITTLGGENWVCRS
jgi:uncharacterized protein